jgi:hypothetical protein
MFTELAYSIVDALIVLLLHTMPISNDYYIMIKEKEEEIGSHFHISTSDLFNPSVLTFHTAFASVEIVLLKLLRDLW